MAIFSNSVYSSFLCLCFSRFLVDVYFYGCARKFVWYFVTSQGFEYYLPHIYIYSSYISSIDNPPTQQFILNKHKNLNLKLKLQFSFGMSHFKSGISLKWLNKIGFHHIPFGAILWKFYILKWDTIKERDVLLPH